MHFWYGDNLLCSVQRELGQDLIGPVFKTLSDLVSTLRTILMIDKVERKNKATEFFSKPAPINEDQEVLRALNASAQAELPFDPDLSAEGRDVVRRDKTFLRRLEMKGRSPVWVEPITRPATRVKPTGPPPNAVPYTDEVPDTYVKVRQGYLELPRLPPADYFAQTSSSFCYHQSLVAHGVYRHRGRWVTPVAMSSFAHNIRSATLLPGGLRLLRHVNPSEDLIWTILLKEPLMELEEEAEMFETLEKLTRHMVHEENKRHHLVYGSHGRALVAWPVSQPEGPVAAKFPVVLPRDSPSVSEGKIPYHDEIEEATGEEDVKTERILYVSLVDLEQVTMAEVQAFVSLPSSYHPIDVYQTSHLAQYGTLYERIGYFLRAGPSGDIDGHTSFVLQTMRAQAASASSLTDEDLLVGWIHLYDLSARDPAIPAEVIPVLCQLATSPLLVAQELIKVILCKVARQHKGRQLTPDLQEMLLGSIGCFTWANASLACKTFELDLCASSHPTILWKAWRRTDDHGVFVVDRAEMQASLGPRDRISESSAESDDVLRVHFEAVHHLEVYQLANGERALSLYVWKSDKREDRHGQRLLRWDISTDQTFPDVIEDWLPDIRLKSRSLPRVRLTLDQYLAKLAKSLNLRATSSNPIAPSPLSSPAPAPKRRRVLLQETPPSSPTPVRPSQLLPTEMDCDPDDDEKSVRDAEVDPESEAYEYEIFEVKAILEGRFSTVRGRLWLQYKIHWKGYDQSHDSWTNYDDYFMAMELLDRFLKKNADVANLATPDKLDEMLWADDGPVAIAQPGPQSPAVLDDSELSDLDDNEPADIDNNEPPDADDKGSDYEPTQTVLQESMTPIKARPSKRKKKPTTTSASKSSAKATSSRKRKSQ